MRLGQQFEHGRTHSSPVAGEPAKDDAGGVLTITEPAVALGVRTSTLRHWETEGLITPERAGADLADVLDTVGRGRAGTVAAQPRSTSIRARLM